MTDRLADEIRALAEARYAANPGLANQVVERVRQEPAPSRWAPWAKTPLAVALTVVILVPVLGFGILLRANVFRFPLPGGESGDTTPALSLGTTGPGGDWVVRRGLHLGRTSGSVPPDNVLYQTADGGRTWTERLRFNGGYDGMSWDAIGRNGTLWTIDWAATEALTVYGTSDGGLHWARRAPTTFPAAIVYFRGVEGWVLSQSRTLHLDPAPIYRTTDAGATWTNVGTLPHANSWGSTSGVGENQFEFASARVGWFRTGGLAATGDSGLYLTTDGGHSWTSVTVSPPTGLDKADMILGYPVLFADGQAVLPVAFGHITDPAYGRDPNHLAVSAHYVYTSADGGLTWTNPQKLEARDQRRWRTHVDQSAETRGARAAAPGQPVHAVLPGPEALVDHLGQRPPGGQSGPPGAAIRGAHGRRRKHLANVPVASDHPDDVLGPSAWVGRGDHRSAQHQYPAADDRWRGPLAGGSGTMTLSAYHATQAMQTADASQ